MNTYDVFGEWLEESYCVARDVPWSVALEIESHGPAYFVVKHECNDELPF